MSENFRRSWCCGTLMTEPHLAGCDFEPRPDEPLDYMGPIEIWPPPEDA